jgi:hypothetical protein
MKKNLLILGIVCLFSFTGIAQTKNVDVDNYWSKIVTRRPPLEPLTPLFYHYATIVHATTAAQKNLSAKEIAGALYIEGEKKTRDVADAEVVIDLNIGNIIITGSNVKDRETSVKNKNGETTKVHNYSMQVTYTFEASFVISANREVLKKASLISPTTVQKFTSGEYPTGKEASNYWSNNKEVLISGFYRDMALGAAAEVSKYASSHYGFQAVKENDVLKIMDEKKHNENEAFKAATAKLKKLLEGMTENEPLNREEAEVLIAYYKALPAKYTDPQSKADVRIRYAAYFNLAKIYYYLDEPAKSGEYADLVQSNGYEPKDGAKLKKLADELKATLDRTEVKTRHFSPGHYFPEEEAGEN